MQSLRPGDKDTSKPDRIERADSTYRSGGGERDDIFSPFKLATKNEIYLDGDKDRDRDREKDRDRDRDRESLRERERGRLSHTASFEGLDMFPTFPSTPGTGPKYTDILGGLLPQTGSGTGVWYFEECLL